MNLRWSFRLRNHFFVRRNPEEYDKAYYNLLEQQFLLKYYGNLSLFEQASMIAEDRAWWMKRIEKEIKDKEDNERRQMASIHRPSRK